MNKQYPLGDILSITTGRLLSERHMDGVYDILNYMTGTSLATHQLPKALQLCAPLLLEQYPHLSEIALQEHLEALLPGLGSAQPHEAQARCNAWVHALARTHGTSLPVPTLAQPTAICRTPGGDLPDMANPDQVIIADSTQRT